MSFVPIYSPFKSEALWPTYEKKAENEITEPDTEYESLDLSNYPGGQIILGFTQTGDVSPIGYLECGASIVRRVVIA